MSQDLSIWDEAVLRTFVQTYLSPFPDTESFNDAVISYLVRRIKEEWNDIKYNVEKPVQRAADVLGNVVPRSPFISFREMDRCLNVELNIDIKHRNSLPEMLLMCLNVPVDDPVSLYLKEMRNTDYFERPRVRI